MAEDLPLDIIVEILARLPVKPLLRFKTVSKTLYCIISNLGFILDNHLEQSLSSDANQLIAVNHGSRILCTTVGSTAETTTFELRPFFPLARQVLIAGSCQGFLAISDYESCHLCSELKVVLLNPSTLSHFVVPGPVFSADSFSTVCLGFGYDWVGNDYKLVLVVFKDVDNYAVEPLLNMTSMVYNLKHNRWGDRSCVVVPRDDIFFGKGTLIDDYCTLHWLPWCRGAKNGGRNQQPILCFDLCSEEWSDLGVVEDMLVFGLGSVGMGCLGVLDGCLCLSKYLYPDYVVSDIWVMKEYGVVESWTKLFRVCGELELTRCPPIAYSKAGGEVLVALRMERRKCLYWYNPKEDSIREADEIPGYSWFRDAALCAGSLVTVPMLKSILKSNSDHFEQSQNRQHD